MAIDTDQIIENAITSPKSMTNAAGETFVARSAEELLLLIGSTTRTPRRRPPFAITRAIPPDTVGPNQHQE